MLSLCGKAEACQKTTNVILSQLRFHALLNQLKKNQTVTLTGCQKMVFCGQPWQSIYLHTPILARIGTPRVYTGHYASTVNLFHRPGPYADPSLGRYVSGNAIEVCDTTGAPRVWSISITWPLSDVGNRWKGIGPNWQSDVHRDTQWMYELKTKGWWDICSQMVSEVDGLTILI